MSFDDKTIPLQERLRECAELDAAEGCEPSVVAMMLEAADEIDRLRLSANRYLWMREQISDDMQWYLVGHTVNKSEQLDAAIDVEMQKPELGPLRK